jgi:predicted adenylyl cyclase CyaB
VESQLLELKAKVKSLPIVRLKLSDLSAHHIGTFHQIDTYYNIHKGRLKLREIKGEKRAELIFYDRENITGLKKSQVMIVEIQKPESFKLLCQRALTIRIVIEKKREIYKLKGTQIHLDCVKDLGTYIEFERVITNSAKDRKSLEDLMKKLKIQDKDLIKDSYSDLALITNEVNK